MDRNGPNIFNSISPLFVFTHNTRYFWYVPKLVDPSNFVQYTNKPCPQAYTVLYLHHPNPFQIDPKQKQRIQPGLGFISRETHFQLFNSL